MNTHFSELALLVERQWQRYGRITPLPDLVLARAEAPSRLMASVYRPSFCVVVQGAKTSTLNDQPLRYTAGQGLLAAIDVPVIARIIEASQAKPYLAFRLAIDPAMVAALFVEQAKTLAALPPFAPLATMVVDAELCDPLIRLLEVLDRPRDLAVLAPLIQREIVWRLLCGPLGATLRQLGASDSHAARIGQTTAWIRDHYAEPLRVADLASLAHMSVPGFHRHFKAVTTITPIQFQKQVRLQEARRLLLNRQDVVCFGME
ncbi:MAG: AraC family transcriptional regulator [Hyphomicrobiales bacterium]|nr:AraC family transcriptional regulator [Hyphomicrobiales bacterium]MDE2115619.1 AraC family transcriptional regulator [Hyphomicrobiales bacterium]